MSIRKFDNATIPDGLRIYAIGDVHGRADCLAQMLRLISEDRASHPVPESRVIFVGDYTDRGPDSAEVLAILCELSNSPEVICLKGNHDDWFEAFLDSPEAAGETFLRWGGRETLVSYGVDMVGNAPRSFAELGREAVRRVPPAHRRFLARLKLSHAVGDFFFCHAGIRPGIALEHQSNDDLMWIRNDFLEHPGNHGKIIVHGHTPVDFVDVRSNRINIDTCAFASGILSCAVLESDRLRILATQ